MLKDGVYISDEDVKAVLKHSLDTKRTIPDNTLRVVDMGKYQLGVAVIHRGAMGGGGGNAGGGAAPANPAPACGEQRPGATGPTGIFHDDTAESYVVISGSAATRYPWAGPSFNGRRFTHNSRSDHDSERPVLQRHHGGIHPGREVKTGDIIIIPEGVPHGFSAIPDHVTYLSIRPDLKKVLQHGYVNPALKK